MHRPKLEDRELLVLQTGTPLDVEKRTRRLQSLADKHDQGQSGKNEKHYRYRDRDINRSLQKSIKRVFQRLFPQTNETETTIFEMSNGMPELFLEIAQNQQTNSELVADLDNVLVGVGKKRKFQKDHLCDSLVANHLFDFIRFPDHGNSIFGPGNVLFADQTNRSQPDLRLALEPVAELLRPAARADQQSFIFVSENPAGEDRGKEIMGKQARDVEPRDEVEEKYTRNERVLGRDQIDHEQSNAGDGLPKAQPMWPKQFVLQKIILGPAERFEQHSEHQASAINPVTSPGRLGARRVKGHHDPDPEPEQASDHNELAKQKQPVKSFRPLCDHVLLCCAEDQSTRWRETFNSW